MSHSYPTLQFDLVSPEARLVSEPVRLAVMPGTEGEFGVGADHVPVVAALTHGVVKLFAKSLDDKPRSIFITGGFVDVAGPECVVLAENAIDVEDLGAADVLEAKLGEQRSDLEAMADVADRMRMEAQIELTEAKIKAVKAKPKSLY